MKELHLKPMRSAGTFSRSQRCVLRCEREYAHAFTVLSWASYMSIDLGRWPNLTAYLARGGSRPKVREALLAEGLAAPDAEAA